MKMIRKTWVGTIISLVLLFTTTNALSQENSTKFLRKDFYSVMAAQDLKRVDAELNLLQKSAFSERGAFEGTLYMKKAGLVKGPAKKLNLFKKGHALLEGAIAKEENNAEFRFLRLMIQEHAPGILGYKDDFEKDSAYIRQSFKKLPVEVQQAITDYSKNSKVLRSEDF